MRYSVLGRTGLRVSALGFGCMRLPMAHGQVQREQAVPMLRRAVELGVNFFDTATMYCGGESEGVLGEAVAGLRGGRERVVISAKNPLRGVSAGTWRAQLEKTLTNLRMDYIDIYNHHGLSWTEWAGFDPARGGLTGEMLKAREEGLIRHLGYSNHDKPEDLKQLIDTGIFESMIVQFNLLDQRNAEMLAYAAGQGMGVIVMGPVGGGRLGLPSEKMQELAGVATTVEAALRFVWGHAGVNVALSGMESVTMLEENVQLAETAAPFTAEQIGRLNDLARERKEKSGMYCSGCRYCVPVCGAGIAIPEQLDLLNQSLVFGLDRGEAYRRWKVTVADCLACGACLKACPQKIEIPTRLREAAEEWDPRFGTVVPTPTIEKVGADGALTMGLTVHNFGRGAVEAAAWLEAGERVTLQTAAAEAGTMDPFGRKKLRVTGTVDPAGDRAVVTAMTVADGHENGREVTFRYLVIGEERGDDWTGGVWHTFQPAARDFTDGGATAGRHAVRFKVERDAEALLLWAEVTDDFLRPSVEARDKGGTGADCLELYLDGREPGRVGMAGYEAGVLMVRLYPGTPGIGGGAFYHTMDPFAMDVRSAAWERGYRIAARVPFKSFCVKPGVPRKIGFDLAACSADETGRRVGYWFFAGNASNWANASGWAVGWIN